MFLYSLFIANSMINDGTHIANDDCALCRACESSLQANTRHGVVRKYATTKNEKAEISRDFSAFFDSKVFRNFVDAFRGF